MEPQISVEILDFRRALREVREGGSMIRAALHQALDDHVQIAGDVLDLGGGEVGSATETGSAELRCESSR